jgi:hypothetical protein
VTMAFVLYVSYGGYRAKSPKGYLNSEIKNILPMQRTNLAVTNLKRINNRSEHFFKEF